MNQNLTEQQLVNRIKGIIILFMFALIVSGITAFPIEKELEILASILSIDINNPNLDYNILQRWLFDVHIGISSTYTQYPFIAYGTD